MNKLNYKIIDKNGKEVESVDFESYDKLADHMLELADKWYSGIYDADDKLEISTFDETGELINKDIATFGETLSDTSIPDDFKLVNPEIPEQWMSGQGFG